MSETVHGRPIAEPADDLDGALAISPADLLERIWRVFISMRTGLALILGVAVLGLIGTLVVQAPPGLSSDPAAHDAWLASVRAKYGGWTGILDALGFFSMFGSIWFRGLVALLMTSVVACSANRAPHLWRQATHPRLEMSPAFFDHAAMGATIAGEEPIRVTADRAVAALRRRRFRTLVVMQDDRIHVYADRFRWAPFGTVIAHLSLVLVLGGVIVGTSFGFRNGDFAAPIGSLVDVGNGTGLTLEATAFTDSYNAETGAPSDYASDIVLYRDGVQVAAQTVRVNQPLRYGDVSFYQSFFGPAAAVRIADANGNVLFDRGVPLLFGSNDGSERIGQIALAEQGLRVLVVAAASGEVSPTIKPGQIQVEVYPVGSQTPVDLKVIDQGKPATIGPLDVTFVRERQFTGLIVARDPGAILVWSGAIALMLGVCLVFFFPNRRIWAQISGTRDGADVRVGALVRHDVAFQSEFQRLIEDLRRDLAGRAES